MVPDPDNSPVDFIYFMFCSMINAADIENRAPDTSLSLEFSLRLPQTFQFLPPSSRFLTTQTVATSLVSSISQPAVSTPLRSTSQLSFDLDSYTDDALKNMDPVFILQRLSDARLMLIPP